MDSGPMETGWGTLLGGRVRYAQPRDGYRTGIEPVLMAAAVPARAGETVLEAGAGAGAALLCLLHRVPGTRGLAVEVDPGMAALARENVAANGAAAAVLAADVTMCALGRVDHAMANPPWHDPAGTPPDGARRRLAKHGDALAAWIDALAAALAPRGTLTMALPASATARALAFLRAAGLGRLVICPLWRRAGEEAKLVLVQGSRGADACRMGAGLVLHEAGGGYTEAAEAVLRGGEALEL